MTPKLRPSVRLLPLALMLPAPVAWGNDPGHALFGKSILLAESALERRGDKLVRQTDEVLEARIDQVGDEVTEALDEADGIVQGAIGKADLLLAARIAQIDASAQDLVASSLGGLDVLSRQTIERITAGAERAVQDLDRRVEQRIDQVDSRIEARLVQVDDAVQSAIESVDGALQARIDQADLAVERRIGNLDVLVSKQTLLLEGSLLKIASLVAALGMIVFGIWPSLRDQLARQEDGAPPRTWKGLGVWWGSRACFATVVTVLLALGARYLPLGSRLEAERLKQAHSAGMSAAVDVLDLSRVRYHAAQLAILDPSGQWCAGRVSLEAELLAHVYAVESPEPAQVEHDLQQLSRWRPAAGPDPLYPLHEAERWLLRQLGSEVPPPDCEAPSDDVRLAEAYFRWQIAGSRDEELAAASQLAEILEQGAQTARFRDRSWLALEQTLRLPVPGDLPAPLARLAALRPSGAESEGSPFEAQERLARLELALADEVAPARVALMEAQALGAKPQRTEAAQRIIAAFRVFDEGLQTLPSSVAVGALAVDDAPLVQALWYAERPETDALAPLLREEPDPDARARAAPLRLVWTRRYVEPLPARLRQILGYQQAQRFTEAERASRDLLAAWVSHARRPTPELARTVACGAAQAGLYRLQDGRRIPVITEGETVCEDGSTVRERYAER